MEKQQSYMKALKCRECGREYPLTATHVCEFDFGPLEVVYDYDRIRESLTHEAIKSRPKSMWRYRELLPVANDPTVGLEVGFTQLIRADRLAKRLGIREVWIKNDAVNYPTLSFKDRVVSVALSRARELGFDTVACASTGNLANSVAANAASAGLRAYVFIPHDLEQGKILNSLIYGANVIGIKGHYDEVNRLCAEIAGKFGWAFVNVNMRPYYAEGSKSMAYEIAEQLGWRIPQHTVVPMASGSLLTKIHKGNSLPGSWSASDRLFTDFDGPEVGPGLLQARQAPHHCQVARDWDSRRRLLCPQSNAGIGRRGGRCHGR
jgi:threonine synthase